LKRKAVLIAIPAAWFLFQEIHRPFGLDAGQSRALAILFAMALWWITETFKLHWTALVPLAVLLLPVAKLEAPWLDRAAANLRLAVDPFFSPFVFLFLGGMLIGLAMEEHNLHRRIALNIIRVIGSQPRRLLLGFVLSTAFISLWISNTATAVMMVPIALAVLFQLEGREGRRLPKFGQSIMLAIAYGANVGGIGTMIGTAPNMIFVNAARSQYGVQISFLDYMTLGLPFVILFLPVVFLMLAWMARRERIETLVPEMIDEELAKLGRMKGREAAVLATFGLACLLWIFNAPLRSMLHVEAHIKPDQWDASAALLAGLILFATSTIGAPALKRLPWDVLILLGGSFALADIVKESGLSTWMAHRMSGAVALHPLALMVLFTTASVFLSAFSSNTATATILTVLVADALDKGRQDARRVLPYMAGVSMAASCDFMLPAGTPPNAIVFGTRYVRMRDMAAAGALLDLAAALLVGLWAYFGVARLIAGAPGQGP
jgi:sodium-dependent dicarboxylate transporter 2/3/5